jgi:RNA polymerase sigma-70 factor (ECF subfamily)
MNDWQLVTAYLNGDERAFESLVARFFPMVYSAAVRQVMDRGLAEEIAQSVFILFSRKVAGLSPKVLLTGWFLRTTRFVARDALKQVNRRQKREQQSAAWAALSPAEEPAWSALAPLVDEALLTLSGPDQDCVVARFIFGRSFREIGEQYQITEDTAQKRVSRSLDKMRGYLERRGLKTAATSIAALLSLDLCRAAGPQLLQAAVAAVKAAASGQAAAVGSVALANSAARALAWRAAAKAILSAAAALALLTGGGIVFWLQSGPALPATAAFQLTDPQLETIGLAWARVAVLAARLIRDFPQGPPAAGDSRAPAYQRDFGVVNQESTRIVSELGPALSARPAPAQLSAIAEILTVELRENLGLNQRQQGAVFALLHEQLLQAAGTPAGVGDLQRNKATLGARINAWLTDAQRVRLEHTYGNDYRGLFALAYYLR